MILPTAKRPTVAGHVWGAPFLEGLGAPVSLFTDFRDCGESGTPSTVFPAILAKQGTVETRSFFSSVVQNTQPRAAAIGGKMVQSRKIAPAAIVASVAFLFSAGSLALTASNNGRRSTRVTSSPGRREAYE